MVCNIVEVMIVSSSIVRVPAIFKPIPERLLVVLLENKQKSKSGGVDIPWILPILTMVYRCFKIYYSFLESF